MITTPSPAVTLDAELEAFAERACAAAGTDLQAVMDALHSADPADVPPALLAGWTLLDLREPIPGIVRVDEAASA